MHIRRRLGLNASQCGKGNCSLRTCDVFIKLLVAEGKCHMKQLESTLHQEAVEASGGGTSVDRTALHQAAVEASGGTSVDRTGGTVEMKYGFSNLLFVSA